MYSSVPNKEEGWSLNKRGEVRKYYTKWTKQGVRQNEEVYFFVYFDPNGLN